MLNNSEEEKNLKTSKTGIIITPVIPHHFYATILYDFSECFRLHLTVDIIMVKVVYTPIASRQQFHIRGTVHSFDATIVVNTLMEALMLLNAIVNECVHIMMTNSKSKDKIV